MVVVVVVVVVLLVWLSLSGSESGHTPATPVVPGTYTKHTPENIPGSK